jgi:predicted ester cyclase
MTNADIVAKVSAMLEAWNARDLDRFVAFFTEDAYWHDLGMPHPPAIGRAAVRTFSESALRAFPDFAYTIRAPICVADDAQSCVVPWTISATHSGVLEPPGFAPTGRRVQFDGLDYFQFRGELVCRLETRFDPADPIGQLLNVRIRAEAGSWLERLLVLAQRTFAAWARVRS